MAADINIADINIIEQVHVPLGARAYDIVIGTNLIANLGTLIKPQLARPSVIVVSDMTVAALYLSKAVASLTAAGIAVKSIVVPAGEASKSFAQFAELQEELLGCGGERSDTLIALGGGVVGDLTGFAAATLRRGMDFIQVPTTLLAQVDSAVGGKTGINTAHGKNLVGAFHQPRMVVSDIETLNTLPRRELLAGYAEVVKYGLIDQPDFFSHLEEKGAALLKGDAALRAKAIALSCKAKAETVAADEHEGGKRALLNLGHTFGHALEAECHYDGSLLHGEAVAVGMVLAEELSAALGLQDGAVPARVAAHLKAVGLPTCLADLGRSFDIAALLTHMGKDKKVRDGKNTFILSQGLGAAFISQDVDMAEVARVFEASAG